MKRTWILVLLAACPALALSQTSSSPSGNTSAPYQPAVPAPSTVNAYGGWPGYSGGASTAAGSALNGMASVISAQGDYNLATSAAAINLTQAQKQEIQNRQQWTNTYFDMRATNRAARAAERSPRPSMEQLARMAQQGVPKSLGPQQMDPVTGKLMWPTPLQQASFDSQREQLDQLFATRAKLGGLSYADQTAVRQTIDAMFSELKSQIRDLPPADYLASRNFLNSVTYAASKSELD
jgi:hypothetical protein